MTGAALVPLLAALAQAPVRGRGTPVTEISSPEIAGGVVTLRLRAPRAREVLVTGLGGPAVPLSRDDEGIWSARVGPLPPGVYSYLFNVDGLDLPDPGNPWLKPGRWTLVSVLEVPDGRAEGAPAGARRGTLVLHEYRAGAERRRVHVYTPADYERGGPYPTVYLLHGYSDTDGTWSAFGRAHVILDELIATGRVPPVVAVMPDGHALVPRLGEPMGAYLVANADAFARQMRDQILPLVERGFRVVKHARGRVALGFAMGAHQVLVCAGLFRAVAAIGPPMLPELAAGPPTETVVLSLPPGHPALTAASGLVAHLSSRGLAASLRTRPESDPWPRWRQDLAELLPRLLPPKPRR